jgi:hypothetical protein
LLSSKLLEGDKLRALHYRQLWLTLAIGFKDFEEGANAKQKLYNQNNDPK